MVKFSPRKDILFPCSFDNTIKKWKISYEIDD
jgi:WD40 repeat protein